jgi:SAM-dependent methyltransferase
MAASTAPRFNMPLEAILAARPLILDLASGSRAHRKKAQGRVTTDALDLPDIDVVCDLNEGFPFLPDNSVDEIYSHNALEHIENLLFLMDEIHRVLKPTGRKRLFVPHFSNPYYYSDPTHHNFFGFYTFYYFSDRQEELKRPVPAFYFTRKFVVEDIRLRFISPFRTINLAYRLVERIVNCHRRTQELYEHSFCYLIPCYGIEVTLHPVKDGPP